MEQKIRKNNTLNWIKGFEINRKIPIGPQIYNLLREAIVSLKLIPGEPISEKIICEELGYSRTPIREAVIKLEDEGLIEVFPQKGTYISKISVEGVLESQFIRETMECAIINYVVNNGTVQLFDKISLILKKYNKALEKKDYNDLFILDEKFHRQLADFCYKKRLWKMINLVKPDMDRLRLMALKSPTRPFEVIKEHEHIFNAIVSKDEKKADEAIKYHLRYIFKEINETKKMNPEYFTK